MRCQEERPEVLPRVHDQRPSAREGSVNAVNCDAADFVAPSIRHRANDVIVARFLLIEFGESLSEQITISTINLANHQYELIRNTCGHFRLDHNAFARQHGSPQLPMVGIVFDSIGTNVVGAICGQQTQAASCGQEDVGEAQVDIGRSGRIYTEPPHPLIAAKIFPLAKRVLRSADIRRLGKLPCFLARGALSLVPQLKRLGLDGGDA